MDFDEGTKLLGEMASTVLTRMKKTHETLETLRSLLCDLETSRRESEEKRDLCSCVSDVLGNAAVACAALQNTMHLYAADIASAVNYIGSHPTSHATVNVSDLIQTALTDFLKENPNLTVRDILERAGMVVVSPVGRDVN
jgi:hypothetical protein